MWNSTSDILTIVSKGLKEKQSRYTGRCVWAETRDKLCLQGTQQQGYFYIPLKDCNAPDWREKASRVLLANFLMKCFEIFVFFDWRKSVLGHNLFDTDMSFYQLECWQVWCGVMY